MDIEERLDRIDKRLDQGDELLRLNRVAFDRNTEAFDRNRDAFDRNRDTFDRMMESFDRFEQREEDLSNFIREITRRNEIVSQNLVAASELVVEQVNEMRAESAAQREGYFALIDRINRLKSDE